MFCAHVFLASFMYLSTVGGDLEIGDRGAVVWWSAVCGLGLEVGEKMVGEVGKGNVGGSYSGN